MTKNLVIQKLILFNPILVGTIPIEIDIPGSDLDIVCCFSDKHEFIASLKKHFETEQAFVVRESIQNEEECVVANFILDDFEIEIFGQNKPSELQNGYRHMLIEYEILQKEDERFRQGIISLKRQGLKTEPAFAKMLNLQGDPYEALLNYFI